jgi:HAD superfamily hydrolase (TIGR01490 family)
MNGVAAFDCDGTLIRGDATRLFLWRARGPLGCLSDLLAISSTLIRWQLGRLSTAAFKERLLARALSRTPPSRVHRLLAEVIPAELIARLRPEARQRLTWHRQQGHRVVIVTASPRFLIQPLADHLGVDLLATETSDPRHATAEQPFRLQSPNCKGAEKVQRLEQWLVEPMAGRDLHAYGDTQGDRQLLEASTVPHWRSFDSAAVPYPQPRQGKQPPWISLFGLLLLALAMVGVSRLPEAERRSLLNALGSLPLWLPLLYGLLLTSFTLRYWRWRVLLDALSIGRWSRADALHWFRGFALTATPGKLGELGRVQALHDALGYPRTPLIHVFFAERTADVVGVVSLLLLLAPAQLLGRLPSLSGALPGPALALVAGALLVASLLGASLRHPWMRRRIAGWRNRWRHRLPDPALVKALIPASGVSLLVWCTEPMLLFLLTHILSPGHLGVAQAITIYLLSGTAGMASSLPGGLGVNEAATVLLLTQQGVPIGTGLPIAILRRLITPWSIVALASLSGSWQKVPRTTAPNGVPPSPGSCVPSDTGSAASNQARQ